MAHRLNISQGGLSDLESGNNLPSYETIMAICNEFDVSSEWLLFDNIVHSNLTSDEKKILDLYRSLNDKDKNKIEGIMEEKLKDSSGTAHKK